jgi:hypothetical protein
VIAALCALVSTLTLPSPSQLKAWGQETVDFVESRYRIPGSPLMLDKVVVDGKSRQPAFDWGVGVWLSALNAATIGDPRNQDALRSFSEATQQYWNTTPPVAGFDVLPGQKDADRYYDDNEWMVMALADSSTILHSRTIGQQAINALNFVLSGESSTLGGGIYWKERGKTSKNACSNGPGAAAAISIYNLEDDPRLVSQAASLYAWTKSHLQDPSDHLYWDNIDLNGKIQKMKWSYNSALMIRSASELYRLTKNEVYAADTRAMVRSSIDRWIDPLTGSIKDGGRFAHLLIESWLWAQKDVPSTFRPGELAKITIGPLVYIHEKVRHDGFYEGAWDRAFDPGVKRFELIDQASAARAYFMVGNFFSAHRSEL